MKKLLSVILSLCLLLGLMPAALAYEPTFDYALNTTLGEYVFDNDAVNPWAVDATTAGRISVKSTTAGIDSSYTSVQLSTTVGAGKAVSFD